MNGKGDRDRTRDRRRYESNYERVDWHTKNEPRKRYKRCKVKRTDYGINSDN